MQQLPSSARSLWATLLLVLELALIAGAGVGIIYWALHGSLLGVALSALLPGPGAVWLLASSRTTNPSVGE